MVIPKLYGRLGNQMFQIAAAIAYSIEYNDTLFLPKETLHPNFPHYFNNRFVTMANTPRSFYEHRERSHGYLPIPHAMNVILNGYFQSYKYFDKYRKEVIDSFGIPFETKKGVCSIHVRRGDYLLYPTKHPVVTPRYLFDAIEEVFNTKGIEKYLVFSDDIEWCKNLFNNVAAIDDDKSDKIPIKFEFSEGKSELEDLASMSSCEHNIISNSSYSWWAAYLNQNSEKLVVTPHEDNWFGSDNRHLDIADLILPLWHRIKY